MDLAHMHDALDAAYAELLADPRHHVESLEGAACGPHLKHLAVLAEAAAANGVSSEQWRADLLSHTGPDAAPAIDAAQACMHHSGLWPWNS